MVKYEKGKRLKNWEHKGVGRKSKIIGEGSLSSANSFSNEGHTITRRIDFLSLATISKNLLGLMIIRKKGGGVMLN